MEKIIKKSKRSATARRKADSPATHGSGVIVVDTSIVPRAIEQLKHGGTVVTTTMQEAMELVKIVPAAAIILSHPNGTTSIWKNGVVSLHHLKMPPNDGGRET